MTEPCAAVVTKGGAMCGQPKVTRRRVLGYQVPVCADHAPGKKQDGAGR